MKDQNIKMNFVVFDSRTLIDSYEGLFQRRIQQISERQQFTRGVAVYWRGRWSRSKNGFQSVFDARTPFFRLYRAKMEKNLRGDGGRRITYCWIRYWSFPRHNQKILNLQLIFLHQLVLVN
jgi:hypothetical protein